jgi:hypothetical protein
MNRRLLGVLCSGVLLLGTAGCKKDGSLWLLMFEPDTTSETECEPEQLTHNFDGANEQDSEDTGVEDPLLTVTQELTQSDGAVVAQVTGGSEPVLVIGTQLWVGEKDGSTTTFKWDSTETSETTETGDGYSYVVNYVIESLEALKLEFKGSEASGTYKTTMTSNHSWTETDTWTAKDVGVFGGQIPAYLYLEVEGPGGNPVPVHNSTEEVECASAACQLGTTYTCEVGVKVTATELIAEEDDYDALGDAYRAPGVFGDDGGLGE